MSTVSDFIFGGSKITADGDYSHEIKKGLLLGRKVMTNLDNILKGRDITLPTKVRLVKAMVFPVVMHRCESWTVKKAECWKIDAFELWWWRRLLRVPWTARRSNQSVLKEISPGYSWRTDAEAETPILWPPHAKSWLIEETLMLGEIGGRRKRGRQRMTSLDVISWMASLTWWAWVCVNSGSWWWKGRPGVLRFMGSQRVGRDWVSELTDWAVENSRHPTIHISLLDCFVV